MDVRKSDSDFLAITRELAKCHSSKHRLFYLTNQFAINFINNATQFLEVLCSLEKEDQTELLKYVHVNKLNNRHLCYQNVSHAANTRLRRPIYDDKHQPITLPDTLPQEYKYFIALYSDFKEFHEQYDSAQIMFYRANKHMFIATGILYSILRATDYESDVREIACTHITLIGNLELMNKILQMMHHPFSFEFLKAWETQWFKTLFKNGYYDLASLRKVLTAFAINTPLEKYYLPFLNCFKTLLYENIESIKTNDDLQCLLNDFANKPDLAKLIKDAFATLNSDDFKLRNSQDEACICVFVDNEKKPGLGRR